MDRLRRELSRVAEATTDLFLPRNCCGCGADSAVLCTNCQRQFAGEPIDVGPGTRYVDFPVFAVAPYQDEVKNAVVAYKDSGRHDATGYLALVLAAAVAAAVEHHYDAGRAVNDVVLVPMPSSRAAMRRRGGDTMRDLARRAAAELAQPGFDIRLAPVLEVRGHRDQVGLGAASRKQNVARTHRARRAAVGRARICASTLVVLVDDVVTTGATLHEGARALREVDVAARSAAVIAFRERR